MSDHHEPAIHLAFSEKYTEEHSQEYFEKHNRKRLSDRIEHRMAQRALRLAGNPGSILDIPCGTGRFWSMLAQDPGRELLAADYSSGMLEIAGKVRDPEVVRRFRLLQCSAFAITLPDSSVDCVFSIRLMHHIGESTNRIAMLKEFHRVTRDSVIVSLWVDGNYKAWRRRKLEEKRRREGEKSDNRFVVPRAQFEHECRAAGFAISGHVDFLPRLFMWRTYVLRKSTARVSLPD
ncbi:MAG: class I SAM-dependent methyltransferase [Candidatus Accumulibacter sp.]|uniref:class I SAM-dependent methyltransferase n=1 Tax=Accumulibacter sp. TaxID=2053492 RepID=UPI002879FBC6|nr:class I SAM-dependent methyltransferase [Accumulibacter sp.]MDS4015196.1 class I SAM-dependent methyltransferase [Accumulibacter sp.]